MDDLIEVCHGSPFDEDAYIFDELDALRALRASVRPLCLYGHTHHPATFELADGAFDSLGPVSAAEAEVAMREGSKYLINPGSVGQPRDGDSRAATPSWTKRGNAWSCIGWSTRSRKRSARW